MHQGKAIIFSAPSGAGKTTIVKYLLTNNPQLSFSISATTRPRRDSYEVDGKDYYFLPVNKFQEKIENKEFVEWEEVYGGKYYGTLKSEMERIWSLNQIPVFDVDVQGGANLKEYFKDQALAVFIKVPSFEVLEERLRARKTETEKSLATRLEKAKFEMSFEEKFDRTLINEDLNKTLMEAEGLVNDFLKSKELKVGLFFGSFNPIHVGHLIVANVIANLKEINQVWFVVSPQNPLKSSKSLIHEFDRYDMVQAAIHDSYNLKVTDVEFQMPTPSFTIDTLTYLAEKFPDHQFELIIGEDNLFSFPKWKNYQKIIDFFGLYVYPRPQSSLGKTSKVVGQILEHPRVKRVEAPILDISASFIRKCVKENKSIKYLVTEPVAEIIESRKLYV